MATRIINVIITLAVVVALAMTAMPRSTLALSQNGQAIHATQIVHDHGAQESAKTDADAKAKPDLKKLSDVSCCDFACHASMQIDSDVVVPSLPGEESRPLAVRSLNADRIDSLFRPPRQHT